MSRRTEGKGAKGKWRKRRGKRGRAFETQRRSSRPASGAAADAPRFGPALAQRNECKYALENSIDAAVQFRRQPSAFRERRIHLAKTQALGDHRIHGPGRKARGRAAVKTNDGVGQIDKAAPNAGATPERRRDVPRPGERARARSPTAEIPTAREVAGPRPLRAPRPAPARSLRLGRRGSNRCHRPFGAQRAASESGSTIQARWSVFFRGENASGVGFSSGLPVGRPIRGKDMRLRWAVNVGAWDPSPPEFAFLLDLLRDESERLSILRYRMVEDQRRALVSRLLQLAACGRALGVPSEAVRLERTKGGKPFASEPQARPIDAPNFNFSVSHEVRSTRAVRSLTPHPDEEAGLQGWANASGLARPLADAFAEARRTSPISERCRTRILVW